MFFSLNVTSWERRAVKKQTLDTPNSLQVSNANDMRESLSFFDYWICSILQIVIF